MPEHVRTCVTIEKELLDLARKHKINVSRALEEKLVEILREKYGIEYYTKEYVLENIRGKRKVKLDKIVKVVKKISSQ